MFELIYRNKNTGLRDDSRLTYFSFATALRYPEVKHLLLFSTLFTANQTINTSLPNPLNSDYYPFESYVYGANAGLILIALFSDCFMKENMIFAAPFLLVTVSTIVNLGVFIFA